MSRRGRGGVAAPPAALLDEAAARWSLRLSPPFEPALVQLCRSGDRRGGRPVVLKAACRTACCATRSPRCAAYDGRGRCSSSPPTRGGAPAAGAAAPGTPLTGRTLEKRRRPRRRAGDAPPLAAAPPCTNFRPSRTGAPASAAAGALRAGPARCRRAWSSRPSASTTSYAPQPPRRPSCMATCTCQHPGRRTRPCWASIHRGWLASRLRDGRAAGNPFPAILSTPDAGRCWRAAPAARGAARSTAAGAGWPSPRPSSPGEWRPRRRRKGVDCGGELLVP